MKALLQDLRYACRLLLRSPGFTLLAALTLALGIGANAAIFSVANSVLLKPLPYRDSGRLMIVYSQFPSMGFGRFWVDPMEFTDYSRWNRSFQSLGAYATGPVNVSGRGEPVRADAAAVTAGLFTRAGRRRRSSGATSSPPRTCPTPRRWWCSPTASGGGRSRPIRASSAGGSRWTATTAR